MMAYLFFSVRLEHCIW